MNFKSGVILLSVFLLGSGSASAGWLLWQSPDIAPTPKNEKTAEISQIIPALEDKADDNLSKKYEYINIVFSAQQNKIRQILTQAGWTETCSEVIKSIGASLIDLSAGIKTVKFPPAYKLFIDGNPQDMSFVMKHPGFARRDILRIWRLPFKTPESDPVWCAAITQETMVRVSSSSYKCAGEKENPELKDFKSGMEKASKPADIGIKTYYINRCKKTKPAEKHDCKISKCNILVVELH